ncbi:methyl-accepting chemotaxis protein [Photobacterium lipolyticum]|uniref:Methyl-accepting chemotaxis protein n=1 Tax=Photobacterium lipolyticum TaxID=266810 RepID=A0A2T3MVU9_9GAMM|nr:methyl-accepting chemotaxis protein [Photobacterium lipolyticum]PSW04060.1 methyl-accepting chemotaxis protein [Photobacterium lipolyticum]
MKFREFTLNTKLSLLLILIVLTVTTTLSLQAASTLKKHTTDEAHAMMDNISRVAALNLSVWMDDRINTLKNLSKPLDKASHLDALQQAQRSLALDDAYYADAQGYYIRSFPSRVKQGYDARIRPWYQQAITTDRLVISKPLIGKNSGIMKFILSMPTTIDGVPGVVGAAITTDYLVDALQQFKLNASSHVFLIHQDGTIIAHDDPKLVLSPASELDSQLLPATIVRAAQHDELLNITFNGQKHLLSLTKVNNSEWYLAISQNDELTFTAYRSLLKEQAVIASGLTLVAVLMVTLLIKIMLKGLVQLTNALKNISHGDGDLTVRLPVESSDEVGQLADAFNHFVSKLQTMMSDTNTISVSLSEQAANTSALSEAQNQKVHEQYQQISCVATAVNQMAAATQSIASNAEATARQTHQASEISDAGYRQVLKSQSAITHLADEIENTGTTINQLNSQAQNISAILSTIRSIAEQTNLLALNAAIEAARAGEQGRGFAVVADEVRVLSQRTHSSTQEIQSMIEDLQSTTSLAVKYMADSQGIAKISVIESETACNSLLQITNTVSSITDIATQTASAAEEQSLVTEEITRNTEALERVANQIAQDTESGHQQAEALRHLAEELNLEVNQYKI